MTFLYVWLGIGAVFGLLLDAYGHEGFSGAQRFFCWCFNLCVWPVVLAIGVWMAMFDKGLRERVRLAKLAAIEPEEQPDFEPISPKPKPKPAPSPLMEPTWQPQTLH